MTETLSILGGAIAGGLVSWLLTLWQFKRARQDRLADARLDLVRRLARHKSGSELALALNEVPILFGQDEPAMSAYRLALPTDDGKVNMSRVVDLLHLLAGRVGLPQSLSPDELARGFSG